MSPVFATVLKELTAISEAHAGAVCFAPTVVRFGPGPTEYSLMNRQEGGWGQRSVTYPSIEDLARCWRLRFVDIGEDDHGRFIRVEPIRK